MLNVARLREEIQFITINPDKHEQGFWAEARTEAPLNANEPPYDVEAPNPNTRPSACGSFGCLAGNTAIHEPGVELDWYQGTYFRENGKKIQIWQADNILNEFVMVKDWYDGTEFPEAKSISKKAQELLGLTDRQAEMLFDGDNTLDDIWDMADRFTGGEINADKSEYARWDESSYAYALKLREEKEQREAQDKVAQV